MLDDIIGLDEAALRFGRTPNALRKAAERGTLEAKRVTPRCWITTPDMVAAYIAHVTAFRRVRRPLR